MRLSDHFLAARDTLADLGNFATWMTAPIKEAQRFEIADDVARAAHELVHSKPSTLAAALPLCRMPYPVMWMEWRGGLGRHTRRDGAPIPSHQGVLIESMDGQVGFMTFGWIHPDSEKAQMLDVDHQVNISPVAVYFDWRSDGNVNTIVKTAHRAILETRCKDPVVRTCVQTYLDVFDQKYLHTPKFDHMTAKMFFTGFKPEWTKHADNNREIEAMNEIERHVSPGVSPHGVGLIATVLATSAELNRVDLARKFIDGWELDIQGEGTFVECLLAMMNSKNPVVEHAPVDLTKLNKSRVRQRKLPFLGYSKTRLSLSRGQANIARAHGIDREAARQHLVRGHFKIRKSGVYWWSPFLRGDATKGKITRQEYDVVHP